MSLILKLQLNTNNRVLVTNLQTQEAREVSLGFIQDTTHDSLGMLIQYGYFELLRNTETIWQIVKQSNIKAELELESVESKQSLSLILILESEENNTVLVTNSLTNESRVVTMRYLQAAAGDSLLLLVQYGYYELLINTQKVWQQVQKFDREREKLEQVKIDQKFRDIMVNDAWLKITDHDREMYHKALASWTTTYNSQSNKPSFNRFVFIPVAGGAIAGALTYSTVGGMGIAAAGTAFGVGAVGLTALGSIGGLAAYGIGKAIT